MARETPSGRKLLLALSVAIGAIALLEGASRLLVRVVPNAGFDHNRRLLSAVGIPGLTEVLEPDPVLFWKLRSNLDHHLVAGTIPGGKGVRFATSTDGEHCRRGASTGPVNRLAVFLGDSCTFGIGVEDEEAFPALLEKRIPGLVAINAGVPGYTAFQGRRRLETLQLPRAPDVVVIAFGFNDAESWDDIGDDEHAASIGAEARRFVHRLRIFDVLAGVFSRSRVDAPVRLGPVKRPRLTDEEYAREIRSIVQWCRDHGSQPVLLAWPYAVQMESPIVKSKQAVLARLADTESIAIVDLVPAFRAHGGARLFADVVHANAEGCRVVADTLRDRASWIFHY
jgi:lysophospholipase L1-like esterase